MKQLLKPHSCQSTDGRATFDKLTDTGGSKTHTHVSERVRLTMWPKKTAVHLYRNTKKSELYHRRFKAGPRVEVWTTTKKRHRGRPGEDRPRVWVQFLLFSTYLTRSLHWNDTIPDGNLGLGARWIKSCVLPLLMSWYSSHSFLWTCLLGYQMVQDSWKPYTASCTKWFPNSLRMETKSPRCVAPSREWMAELNAGRRGGGTSSDINVSNWMNHWSVTPGTKDLGKTHRETNRDQRSSSQLQKYHKNCFWRFSAFSLCCLWTQQQNGRIFTAASFNNKKKKKIQNKDCNQTIFSWDSSHLTD